MESSTGEQHAQMLLLTTKQILKLELFPYMIVKQVVGKVVVKMVKVILVMMEKLQIQILPHMQTMTSGIHVTRMMILP